MIFMLGCGLTTFAQEKTDNMTETKIEKDDKLTELGITVKYAGVDLTSFIKEEHVVTF